MEFHYIASLNLNQLIFGCWKESVSRPVNVCKHSIQIRLRFDFRFWSSFLYKLSHTHTARTEINTRAKFELQTILRQRRRFCHFFSLTLSLYLVSRASVSFTVLFSVAKFMQSAKKVDQYENWSTRSQMAHVEHYRRNRSERSVCERCGVACVL